MSKLKKKRVLILFFPSFNLRLIGYTHLNIWWGTHLTVPSASTTANTSRSDRSVSALQEKRIVIFPSTFLANKISFCVFNLSTSIQACGLPVIYCAKFLLDSNLNLVLENRLVREHDPAKGLLGTCDITTFVNMSFKIVPEFACFT